MKRTWKTMGRSSFLPLRDAVLCADCNFVSADEEDRCSVCGGRSLRKLPELLDSRTVTSASLNTKAELQRPWRSRGEGNRSNRIDEAAGTFQGWLREWQERTRWPVVDRAPTNDPEKGSSMPRASRVPSAVERKRKQIKKRGNMFIDPIVARWRGQVFPCVQSLYGVAKLLMLSAVLLVAGCGGSKSNLPLSQANTQLKIGDSPADSVIAFELTLTQVSLTAQSGSTVTVFSGSSEVELSHLAGTVEPLALANVPTGTYTKATIGFAGAEVTYIPSASTTPVEKQFTTSGTVTVPLSALNISNGSNVLSVDVNVAQSLVFDAGGNVTGVTPVFTLSNTVVAAENAQEEENGGIEDATGTVSAAPANNAFTLNLQMAGLTATFNVNSNTQFSDGLNSFADIKQGMLLEVDAHTRADGSLLATNVELVENQGVEAEGIVTAIANPATQFTIVDDDGAGAGFSSSSIGSPINVNLTASTGFRANLEHVDMSGLSFSFSSSANLAKGQNVEVESTSAIQNNTALTADKVILIKQSLTGTVSNAAVTGSSGTFTLNLPADSAFAKLTGLSTVTVHQQPGTELKGLTAVANGATVRVRGLLFFDGANYQLVATRIGLP